MADTPLCCAALLRRRTLASLSICPQGQAIRKNVFVAFYQGDNLKSRLKKVCTGYHASLYNCPSSVSEREAIINELRVRLEDLNVVLGQTLDHRHRVLVTVAKELRTWCVMVRKMKAIYHTLNRFNMDVTNKCLIAECWVPKDDLHRVRRALEDGGVGGTLLVDVPVQQRLIRFEVQGT